MKVPTAIVFALALAGLVAGYSEQALGQTTKEASTTLNGCLESTEGKYALTKATGNDQVKDKRIALTPAEKIDLKAHVGHRVEVTGQLTDADKQAPQMKVTAFKHVSASCG